MLMRNRLRTRINLASGAINRTITRKVNLQGRSKYIASYKMAQVAKIDVAQAVKMGVELPAFADLKQQKDIVVRAKDLVYAKPETWKFHGDIAEFVGEGNPQVHGTYGVKNLDKGVKYEVFYCVSMKNHQVSSPVKLTLQLPLGSHEITETITVNPHKWKAVSVGKFLNVFPTGDIKFTFYGVDANTWKGLRLACVLIRPSM